MATLRGTHRRAGLAAALFGLTLALSGAVLSIDPLREAATTGSLVAPTQISVARLAQAVSGQLDGVERIEKTANHTVIAHFSTADGFGRMYFDPSSLTPVAAPSEGPVMGFVKRLHRSFFLGGTGRATAGVTALLMLVLSVSGLAIAIRRMGGWRSLISAPTTGRLQRIHLLAGRIAAPGLLIAAATGVFLSLATFDFLPAGGDAQPDFPIIDAASSPLEILDIPALRNVSLSDFRELVFPYPNDPTDAYMLTTSTGSGYIDPYTGQLASFAAPDFGARLYETIYLLHTGQGAWLIGLLLGFCMLAVPFVIVTGLAIALRRPKSPLRGVKTVPASSADTIILVGSEGGSTWGFAAELSRKLAAAGKRVHVAEMNDLAQQYPNGETLFLLSSTYGAGAAPESAGSFLSKLEAFDPGNMRCAVLGFGDQTFAEYCRYAVDIDNTLADRGARRLCPLAKIDRQSGQSFAAWGRMIGQAMGISLDLVHRPHTPPTTQLRLLSTRTYGESVQAPVSVLRFRARGFGRLPRHAAGDLLAVLAPGGAIPRYYSLASNHRGGWIEICVRKQPGGLCSGHLCELAVGDTIDAFVMSNPMFKATRSSAPLILVGAGAGLAPLVGFLRENTAKRPAHLFWGGRDPQSDYLYQDELTELEASGRLSRLTTTFSRLEGGGYVQAKLRASARELQDLVTSGAQVLVCGGQAMGRDVRKSFDAVLQPVGLNVDMLKQQERYLEDVY
ncbi:MAG: nitric oxide synthase [Rhodobacteraceae bacterium]|nr:nitric oxide synthase [Paracoccaceae bacterium]